MVNNNTIYGDYIIALANKSVSAEMREEIYMVVKDLGIAENAFGQILTAYIGDIDSIANEDDVISGIRDEYTGIHLEEFFGDFGTWENYLRLCIMENRNDSTVIDLIEHLIAFVETNTDVHDAIKYAAYKKCLSSLLYSSFATTNVELLQKLVDLTKELEEVPYGAEPMNWVTELIRK